MENVSVSAMYIPAALFLAAALGFGVLNLVAARIVRAVNPNPVKSAAYECGVPVKQDARGRVSIHYYVIAVLFLIFDVETIFLFPWALKYDALALFGLVEMALFLAILLFGYLYAWRKGALDWIFADDQFGRL
jgi:NADH-quinone oxidoreductase subunit A